jgi:hypothetical protein
MEWKKGFTMEKRNERIDETREEQDLHGRGWKIKIYKSGRNDSDRAAL